MAATALIMGGVSQGLGIGPDAAPPSAAESATGQAQIDQRVAQADQELAALEEQLARFENVPPAVMVSPLATETKTIATFTPSFVIFYAPGVLALILQHVAISIASLALVRQKLFGAMELFRVAPITAFEILLGKYGSYLLFVGFLAVVLTAAMINLLGVPLLGSVAWLALSLALLIFASLGIGFAISATSRSHSDAVQFAAGASGVDVLQRFCLPAAVDHDTCALHRLPVAGHVQYPESAECHAQTRAAGYALPGGATGAR